VHDVPDEIRTESNYLFYLHGQIIEDHGLRPVHPDFGVYEYEGVLASLAQAGFVVISEARGPRTNGEEYAREVVTQVETLLAAGVPPERVSIVGFSKGGGIAVRVSTLLHNERVNFVFLGTCARRIRNRPALDLRGRILSIYEASDPIAGPCSEFLSASVIEPEFEEVRLEVGGGHGAFYRPVQAWLDPVLAWSKGREVPVADEP
jgi:predicted esterase